MSSEHDDHEAAHGHAGGADDDILVGGDAAEHPHDIPPRRRLTVALVAAAVLAAAGGGAYWAVSAGGGKSPTAHPGTVVATATAPGGVATGPGTVAGTGGDYRLTGTLPADGPSSAPSTAPTAAPTVPRSRGSRPCWASPAPSSTTTAPGGSAPPTVRGRRCWSARTRPARGRTRPTARSPRGPGTWSRPRSPGPAPGGRRPADSGASTSHRAESTPPVPEQQARAAAAPVLDGLGLSDAQVDASRTVAATRTVTADPVVGGLPTHGWDTSLDVDPNGRVTGGHGRLSPLAKGDSRQVISAQQAYRNLSSQRIMHPDHRMSCQVPMPDKGNAAGPAVSPTLPGQDKTLPTSLPCVAPRMAPIDITGARFGLAPQFVPGGGQALLPAWLFDAKPEGAAAGSVIAQSAVEQPASQGGGSAPGTGSPGKPGVAVAAYQPHGSSLTLTFWGGICDTYSASAVETPTQVRVTVTATPMHPGAPCPDLAKSENTSVTLSAPLGTRTVVDASTDSPVKSS
ncbi:hypothetical protein [Actinacidiphila bryophytorum]|uniref:hypothetical protein n=1 Tax=Actinacidiphila bryophytorum TaxID=1436133 RepID=UPI002176B5B0|nr:hypothetical protein [Actinacidiphila bryophytorum]UWE08863.1 hypothetical protein NYE86_09105 [Actinacidiphila bryophytorum]